MHTRYIPRPTESVSNFCVDYAYEERLSVTGKPFVNTRKRIEIKNNKNRFINYVYFYASNTLRSI